MTDGSRTDPVVALCLPQYDGATHDHFAAMMALVAEWPGRTSMRLKLCVGKGSPVDTIRNLIAHAAIHDLATDGDAKFPVPHLTNRPADYLLWVDSDCLLPRISDFLDLIGSYRVLQNTGEKVGLLGVAFPINQSSGQHKVNMETAPYQVRPDGGIYEVKRIGFGCVVHSADVIRRMEWPWFRFDYSDAMPAPGELGGVNVLGEDYRFCEAVRKQGLKVCVDTSKTGIHVIRRAATFSFGDAGKDQVR